METGNFDSIVIQIQRHFLPLVQDWLLNFNEKVKKCNRDKGPFTRCDFFTTAFFVAENGNSRSQREWSHGVFVMGFFVRHYTLIEFSLDVFTEFTEFSDKIILF